MDQILLVILISLVSLLFIFLLVFFIIYLIKNKKKNNHNELKEINKVDEKLIELAKERNELEKRISETSTTLREQNIEAYKELQKSFQDYQNNTNTLLNQKFHNDSKLIVDKFNDLDTKLNKGISDLKDSNKEFKKNHLVAINELESNFNKYKTNTNDTLKSTLENQNQIINNKFSDINNSLESNLLKNTNTMNTVNESLGRLTEAQKNLDSLKSEVTTLNHVLSESKTRGRFGEIQLESLLEEVFGETHDVYSLQTSLSSGKRPDAIIYLYINDEKLNLCIDSKFSFNAYANILSKGTKEIDDSDLVEFKQALVNQIKKISEDYTNYKDKCYQYAIMFIPFDAIFYFINGNEYLYKYVVTYARINKVILASPSTLQPILSNIKSFQISYKTCKNMEGIVDNIRILNNKIKNLQDSREKVESYKKKYDEELQNFTKKVEGVIKKSGSIIDDAEKSSISSKLENKND